MRCESRAVMQLKGKAEHCTNPNSEIKPDQADNRVKTWKRNSGGPHPPLLESTQFLALRAEMKNIHGTPLTELESVARPETRESKPNTDQLDIPFPGAPICLI